MIIRIIREYFSSDARVLVLTGTHGDPNSRESGLTDIDLLVHDFYSEDCRRVGVEAGPDSPLTTQIPP